MKKIITILIISFLIMPCVNIKNTQAYSTADAINDLEKIDFELRIRSYLPNIIPEIVVRLKDESRICSVSEIFYNLLFYNIENKDPLYRWYPLDDQDDMTDPAYVTPLILIDQVGFQRISKQLGWIGDTQLDIGEIVISEKQKPNIEWAYNRTLDLNDKLNCSIARQYVDFGTLIFQFEPVHYYNIEVKWISKIRNETTMLQDTFSDDFLVNASIMLFDNL
ncbi:MAG: hypothetical protein ACTSO7_18820, partial [Candidatus Heimdallarchaeota archaeon]